MVLEHRCTKCNSTSCQHRTPVAVTISYSSEPLRTGLEYTPATCTTPTEAAEPSEGDFLSLKPLSYPFKDSQESDAEPLWAPGESLTWDAAERGGEEHQKPCRGHGGGVWSLQAACSHTAHEMVPAGLPANIYKCNV